MCQIRTFCRLREASVGDTDAISFRKSGLPLVATTVRGAAIASPAGPCAGCGWRAANSYTICGRKPESIVMAMMGMVPPDSHGQSTASNASNSCQTSGEDVLSGCPD